MRPYAIAPLILVVSFAAVAVAEPPAPTRACAPLRIDPPSLTLASRGAAQLHALGGSGNAFFALEGDAHGGAIEPGGGLRAGDAGTFTAIARDGLCRSEARARIEVVGAFRVAPENITLAPGGSVELVASGAVGVVTYQLLDGDSRAELVNARFRAGPTARAYHLLVRDTGSGREARVTIRVGAPEKLRPRAEVIALPAGSRVRLDWRGGSGSLAVQSVTGAGVKLDAEARMLDAKDARAGESAEATVVDRFTSEVARVRILVGDTLGAPPVARGTQTSQGDMATGDVNGDGLPDLVVGHAERSKTAFEAGGILVYYGKADGTFTEPPDTIDGDHAVDRYGSVLAVRDVNGDGIDDVVAGIPDEDLGEIDRGALAVYLGSKSGIERDPDRVLAGEGGNHRFGTAVAIADLNGDGAPEIVTTAPGARNPFATACDGGRVYVYKNLARPRGITQALPSQVIDVRDTCSDEPEAPVACDPGVQGAGRAVALVDLDGDRVLDLVVGAPQASFPAGGRGHGAVLVFRGLGDAKFDDAPSWAIHLEPSLRADGALFGASLDVAPAGPGGASALVVRAPSFVVKGTNALGALWVFAPGALGAAPAPATPRRVRNVTTSVARAIFAPDGSRGFGRSGALADVDPRAGVEYVVGAAAPNAPGAAYVFGMHELGAGGAPIAKIALAANEMEGFRVAGVGRAGAGLAVWAPWRSTAKGAFVGAIDFVGPGTAAVADRWKSHGTIALPNFGAGDRAGSSVVLGALDAGPVPHAIVGAPGAHSPAMPNHVAGERIRTGTVDVFGLASSAPIARASIDRADAQLGSGPIAVLDFDGDGVMDLAVGDPAEAAGGPAPPAFVDPDHCEALDAKGSASNVGARGVVRIYSLAGGRLVERFRVTAPREAAHEDGGPRYWRNRTGFSIAAADVNGDGMDDLLVGRPGTRDANGAEIVLGRKADPGGKILVACNGSGALAIASAGAADPVVYGTAVARLGDLDRDGCDEVALSMTRAGFVAPNVPRAGILVAFGYDPTGAHCAGHKTPFLLRVVPDDHPLANDVVGDAKTHADDTADLRGAPTGMGAVLARGSGDVTGDGVPDLVFRDGDLAFGEQRGPAVEVVSGAFLASLCPNRACPQGQSGPLFADGDWRVVALRGLPPAHRRIVPSSGFARSFGASLAVGDVTGDGVAELAIGSSDDADEGAFTGEVRVFRGGAATTTQDALLGDPWLLAVGDTSERGAFGASIAMSPANEKKKTPGAWLLVGAPTSSRKQLGGNVGAAYRFHLEAAR